MLTLWEQTWQSWIWCKAVVPQKLFSLIETKQLLRAHHCLQHYCPHSQPCRESHQQHIVKEQCIQPDRRPIFYSAAKGCLCADIKWMLVKRSDLTPIWMTLEAWRLQNWLTWFKLDGYYLSESSKYIKATQGLLQLYGNIMNKSMRFATLWSHIRHAAIDTISVSSRIIQNPSQLTRSAPSVAIHLISRHTHSHSYSHLCDDRGNIQRHGWLEQYSQLSSDNCPPVSSECVLLLFLWPHSLYCSAQP